MALRLSDNSRVSTPLMKFLKIIGDTGFIVIGTARWCNGHNGHNGHKNISSLQIF